MEVEPLGTLVFVPAWNEEASLPSVLAELRRELRDADVLVIDDGSSDRTAERAREAGAEVLSFPANRGLPVAIAAGYGVAVERGYRLCGRVDADGQHPAAELRRLLGHVRSGAADVAVGSRFVSGGEYPERRYQSPAERQLGHFVLRRLMRWRLDRPMMDATSGMYAVNARAAPILARPYNTGAPEVEGLIRLAHAGLVVDELPVHMRERLSGESKLRGKKALLLVLTVGLTVLVGDRLRRRRRS
ncbi:MAG: glycosyl transferase family 2 [Candidatus Rokuibacteriota bacterium]|nr:MAG: glycosyl transferase family 2 [Candidatus Rokubacteria bacterium]